MLGAYGPAQARLALVLVKRRETIEVDAARYHPDVAARGCWRQRRPQVLGDRDHPVSAECRSPGRKNPEMNGEPPERRLRATAEEIAPPILNEHRAVTDCIGREIGHYASIREMYERGLSPLDCVFELLAKPPVGARATTPTIEMQDLDFNTQLTHAPNLLFDEDPVRRARRRRVHVCDDEDAQGLAEARFAAQGWSKRQEHHGKLVRLRAGRVSLQDSDRARGRIRVRSNELSGRARTAAEPAHVHVRLLPS